MLSLLIACINLGHPDGLSPWAPKAELANALVYLSATPEGQEGHFLFNSLSAPVFISPTLLCRTVSGPLMTKDSALSLAASATCRALERRVEIALGVEIQL